MASSPYIRESLASIIDRLHVEKIVLSEDGDLEGKGKAFFKDVVNSALLEDPKNTLFTVSHGGSTKVRKRVYMLRRSKTTEGASLVCEICGHLTFKLFPTALAKSGKRANELRIADSEIVQACRSCFIEQNGGHSLPNKANDKSKIQPLFEHHPCGITIGRASDPWHFVRRDIICNKVKSLVNHQCNEEQYRDEILSDMSDQEMELSKGEDTCYEDSDTEQCFIKNNFSFQNRNIENSDFESEKSLQLSPNQELPIICEGVALLTNSGFHKTVNNRHSEKSIEGYSIDGEHVDEFFKEKLLKNIDTEIGIQLDSSDGPSLNVEFLEQCTYGDSATEDLFHCFYDQKCFIRKIKKQFNSNKFKKRLPSLKCLSPKTRYGGVCKLVTLVCPRKGHFIDNSVRSCLYDVKGFPWRKQDLPPFVGLNTKNLICRKSYRSRKRDVDNSLIGRFHAKDATSVRAEYHSARRDKLSTASYPDNRESKYESGDKESDSKKCEQSSGTDEVVSPPSRKGSVITCVACQRIVQKSYSVYDRDNSPLRMLKYFEDSVKTIRICRTCLPYSKPKEEGRSHKSNKIRSRDTEDKEEPDSVSKCSKMDKDKYYSPPNSLKKNKSTMLTKIRNATPSPKRRIHKNESEEQVFLNQRANSSSVNVKLVRNPDAEQLKKLTESNNTKYVILQPASTSEGNATQKLSTVAANVGSGDSRCGDITINGKRYKIDTEFKLNDLVKENENAGVSTDTHRDLMAQLPSILKRTIGNRNGAPTKYKIVNVSQSSKSVQNYTKSDIFVQKTNRTSTASLSKLRQTVEDKFTARSDASKVRSVYPASRILSPASRNCSVALSTGASRPFPVQRNTRASITISHPSLVKTAAKMNNSVTLPSITRQIQEHLNPKVATAVISPTAQNSLQSTVHGIRPANTLFPKSPLNTPTATSSGLVSQLNQHKFVAPSQNISLISASSAKEAKLK